MWLSESGGKNPKCVWWNDVLKAAGERKEAAWKVLLGDKDELLKKNVWKLTKKIRLKDVYIRAKRR